MFHSFQPMPLLKRAAPFDDPDWVVLHFGGIHSSLRVTPAMEAGLTDHVWDLEELVGLLELKGMNAAA